MNIANLSVVNPQGKQSVGSPEGTQTPRKNEAKPEPVSYQVGIVTQIDEPGRVCQIDHSVHGIIADGLLVSLEVGDTVACIHSPLGVFVIQQLIQHPTRLQQIKSRQELHICASSLRLQATDDMELVSLNRCSMVSKHTVISAAETLVTTAEHAIQSVSQFLLSVKGLLRMNGKSQVITAEEDVRVDGKRINMG